jgi:hypothetical protein
VIRRIDWRAVLAGSVLALVVLGVTIGAVALVDVAIGLARGSNWVFAFYAVALSGLAAGGWLAARRRPEAALAHGLLAALGAYAVLALAVVVVRLILDRDLDPVALGFNALTAASAGILGTLIAERKPA